ncbi:MAG: aspartyl protease family protein [Rhizomicrobium sp.]
MRIPIALCICLVIFSPLAAEGECEKLAVLDLGMDPAGGPTVAATINDHPETMLIDTGGAASMLTRTVSDQLALARRPLPPRLALTAHGVAIRESAIVKKLSFGGLAVSDLHFLVIPDGVVPASDAGTLALDVFASSDLAFDFALGKLALFAGGSCSSPPPLPDDAGYSAVPIHRDAFGHILSSADADGRPIEVLIDTGSSITHMNQDDARTALGWREDAVDSKPDARGNDLLVLKSLHLGSLDLGSVPVRLSSKPGPRQPRLIIGMNTLKMFRLFMAANTQTLYIAPAR